MSLTVNQVSSTLSAALADEVVRLGGVAATASECGISDDSVRRRLAGTHDWSAGDIARIIASGISQQGSSLVLDRLEKLTQGALPIGDDRRAAIDARDVLAPLLREASDLAEALRNGPISPSDARTLLADIDAATKMQDQLRADLVALLRNRS